MSAAGLALVSGLPPFTVQTRVARIGYMWTGIRANQYLTDALRDGLREAGWIEGQNLIIDYRTYGDQPERIPDLAAELVALKPDVVAANSTLTTLAFMRASESIPIVMLLVTDPVGSGLIASYARPGGRVTGATRTAAMSSGVKLIDLLQQLVPGLARVAFVFERANPPAVGDLRDMQAAAQSVGVEVQAVAISSLESLEPELDAALPGQPQALITTGGVIIPPNYSTISAFAIQHGLPSASDTLASVAAGGLLYYGPQQVPLYRHAGNYYLDRILRGAKPADLPVEQPTVFDLILNRTTAQRLGVTIPPEFAAQVTDWVD